MDPLEMTALTRHQGMEIMGHLLLMIWKVALAAVPGDVPAMARFRGLGMTDHAGLFCVRRLGIFCRVHQGNLFPRHDLSRRPELGMTVEAGDFDLFSGIDFFRLHPTVTGHARFILRRKRRELFLFLMASPTLFMARFGGIKLDPFLDRSLLVRVVAGNA